MVTPLDEAREAFLSGQFEEAFTLLTALEATGNAEVQYLLGELFNGYLLDHGPMDDVQQAVRQHRENQMRAIHYYTLASEQGYGWASNDLARLYAEMYVGLLPWSEVEQKAKQYFQRAAQQGVSIYASCIDDALYWENCKQDYIKRVQRMDRLLESSG